MIDLPDHMPDLRRLKALYSVIFVMIAAIIARLWYLQVVKGPEYAAASATRSVKTIPRVAPRGIIVDCKGRVLATSRPKFVVSIAPDDVKKNPLVLGKLAELLKLPEEDLRDRLTPMMSARGSARYDPVPLVRDVNIETLAGIEERRLDLPGVLVTRDPVRYYNDGGLCTHLLGVTRSITAEKLQKLRDQGYRPGDYVGTFGLEAYYDAELRGQAGGTDIVVDAHGRMQRSLGQRAPIPGQTLQLALDLDLQRVAADGLRAGGKPGAVVALDPNTGGVLALASYPTYDLNRYGTDIKAMSHDPMAPMINRASGSAFPCGSTFKLVTAAAGLETGAISTGTYAYCPGYLIRNHQRFGCLEHHGSVGFYRAIGESCNVYFYNAALRTGCEALGAMAKRFGLGQKTGIDLPDDKKGLVPTPDWKRKHVHMPWFPGDTINMAIGQGMVLVSPLQLANYTAALANGGTLYRPHLVNQIIDPVKHVARTIEPVVQGTLGLQPGNLRAIVAGMELTMRGRGTAAACALPGLTVAGKTGTVQIRRGVPNNAMFVCFAPVEHPRIAIAVLVQGGGFGAESAAPIARKMLAQYFHIGH
jgi:penicillin-binding protein 2